MKVYTSILCVCCKQEEVVKTWNKHHMCTGNYIGYIQYADKINSPTHRAPRALPFPYEGERTNGLVSQNGHLYAHLEAGSSYYECKTEVNCNTEQHVYEDADTYLKYIVEIYD